MIRTAYISGKITGLSKEIAKDKFNVLAKQLTSAGYHVVKPTALDNDKDDWGENMREGIKHMIECDEVHFLPDWQDSKGAQLKRDIAIRLGMQVVYH